MLEWKDSSEVSVYDLMFNCRSTSNHSSLPLFFSWDPASATALRNVGDASKSIPSSPARSKIVEAQLSSLRTAVGQLRNAYNGQDVEWADEGELY